MSEGQRCLAVHCPEREPRKRWHPEEWEHARWWADYGCCSRSCATDYYGEEAIDE